MKNIHVLPTEKPSRLYHWKGNDTYNSQFRLRPIAGFCDFNQNDAVNQNIYITSDEEIKEGDYCIDGDDIYGPFEEGDIATTKFIKIILTTDEQLIRYGVQAIDDEFLEWFVKNPSCEEVKVGEIYPSNCCINKEGKTKMNNDCMERNRCLHYKIIIPSKDDLKIGDNTNFGIITDINEKSVCFGKNKVGVDVWYKKSYVVKFPNLVLEEPKQETLEEAAENLYPKDIRTHYSMHQEEIFDNNSPERNAFIEGAKWQQEQMYSEEEVIYLLYSLKNYLGFGEEVKEQEWFKQFKKK